LRESGRRYDAILFDFDGVLVDSEPLHFECWNQVLADYGIALDWETYEAAFIGSSDRVMLAHYAERANPPVALETLTGQYPRKRDLFRALMLEKLPFFENCAGFLETLEDYKLAVVSSSGRPEIEPALERAGVRGFFSALVCAADVKNHKPAPDPYLLAARLLNAQSPLVVEDSAAGEASARAAGFDVIRVASPAEVPERVRAALMVSASG